MSFNVLNRAVFVSGDNFFCVLMESPLLLHSYGLSIYSNDEEHVKFCGFCSVHEQFNTRGRVFSVLILYNTLPSTIHYIQMI